MAERAADDRFLGRREQRALMGDRLRRAAAGQPQLVLVEGPAGIGKTSLVRRFLREAAADCAVLWASGAEAESDLPYGVLDQLTDDDGGWPRQPPDRAPLPDPVDAGAALLDRLGRCQEQDGGRCAVLVVDDLEWADTPSLHALAFALRRLRVDQVLTVLTARTTGPARVPAGLHKVLEDERTLRLVLEGLSVEEIAELGAHTGVSRRTAARLRAHTRGNPLYARALFEQFRPEELAGQLPVPRSYAELVNDRLAACSRDARNLVAAASVLGMSAPLHLAGRVGGVTDILAALEEAAAAGLLTERDGHDGLPEAVFTHPLQRAAVRQGLSARRRLALHATAATLVTDPAEALHHRVRAAVAPDDTLAAELERAAARYAADGAWSAAAARLLAVARTCTDPHRRDTQLLQAVEHLLLAGDIGRAEELSGTVRALPPTVHRHTVLGCLALESGRRHEARQELTAAWAGLDRTGPGAGDPAGTARGIAERMAWLSLIESDAEEAVAWARRGMETGPCDRISLLRDELTLGLALSGRPQEAADVVSTLPARGPYRGPEELDGLFARGALRMWNGAYEAARRDLRDAVAAHRAHGLRGLVAPALCYLADTAYRAGRWDDAVAHSARAVSLAEDTDHRSLLAMAHAVAAAPLCGRGNLATAQHHVTKALHHAELLADTSNLGYARTALAQLRAVQGDHPAVIEALRPLTGALTGHRAAIDEPGVFPWRQLLVEALVRTGRTEEADSVLALYEKLAKARARWPDQAAAARCRGLLAAALGDTAQAEQAFRTGLDHCAPHPDCWEAALLHHAHGSFLRRTARRGAAATRLEAARELFERVGATVHLEQCRQELAACGRPFTRGDRPAHAVLTPQELTVAQLAAQGMSNRRIARELTLSVKTIEYHLGHVYAKLGLASRAGLATALGAGSSRAAAAPGRPPLHR